MIISCKQEHWESADLRQGEFHADQESWSKLRIRFTSKIKWWPPPNIHHCQSIHWLRVLERIQYKIAVLTYKVLHDTAPRYLGPLHRIAVLHGRRALRSASSSRLVVPMFRLSTVGSQTFNVSGPRIWNGLPEDVVSAPTFSSFRRRLKPFLFQQSYPDIII